MTRQEYFDIIDKNLIWQDEIILAEGGHRPKEGWTSPIEPALDENGNVYESFDKFFDIFPVPEASKRSVEEISIIADSIVSSSKQIRDGKKIVDSLGNVRICAFKSCSIGEPGESFIRDEKIISVIYDCPIVST